MDLGEDPDFNPHPPTNNSPQRINNTAVSLLDLPNSTSDDTSSLTPTTRHLESHQWHHTSMDSQSTLSTAPGTKNTNSKIKLSANYSTIRQDQQGEHNSTRKYTTLTLAQQQNASKQHTAASTKNTTLKNNSWHPATTLTTTSTRIWHHLSTHQTSLAPSAPHHTTSSHPQTKHHSL